MTLDEKIERLRAMAAHVLACGHGEAKAGARSAYVGATDYTAEFTQLISDLDDAGIFGTRPEPGTPAQLQRWTVERGDDGVAIDIFIANAHREAEFMRRFFDQADGNYPHGFNAVVEGCHRLPDYILNPAKETDPA